jgi:hypothetical protein
MCEVYSLLGAKSMNTILPYEAIPFVELPADYQHHLAPLIAQAYQQHGPIFRSTYLESEIVYLVGPEANRFVLVSNRQKFSNLLAGVPSSLL